MMAKTKNLSKLWPNGHQNTKTLWFKTRQKFWNLAKNEFHLKVIKCLKEDQINTLICFLDKDLFEATQYLKINKIKKILDDKQKLRLFCYHWDL